MGEAPEPNEGTHAQTQAGRRSTPVAKKTGSAADTCIGKEDEP